MGIDAIPVNVRQMALTIARAVDLVGVNDVLHGRRVAMMAAECARAMGHDPATQRLLFDAGLLHDCGVSSTRERHRIIDELDWQGANLHCERGYALLRDFAPLAHFAPIVRYHHTHWDELERLLREPNPLDPNPPDPARLDPAAARHANLIYLVDRVDSLAVPYYRDESLLLHVGEIREVIVRCRGRFFAPDLVDAFLRASGPEAFWLLLDPSYIPQYVEDMERCNETRAGTLGELKQFAFIIARIVDAKSHFTAEHSLGVARLARFIGRLTGMSGDHLEKLEIAALMHDIGKLQVPDELLESPAQFSPADRAVMKKHSFATYQILRQVGGFEELALWAAEHHESLNGAGYPFHLRDGDIPVEARIIKVADIFQALAQRRPYRASMPAPDILHLLRTMQAENEVEGALVDVVASNLDTCQALANRESRETRIEAPE